MGGGAQRLKATVQGHSAFFPAFREEEAEVDAAEESTIMVSKMANTWRINSVFGELDGIPIHSLTFQACSNLRAQCAGILPPPEAPRRSNSAR